MENWLVIEGFENYKISNCGQVMNSRGLIMKQRTTPSGYKEIGLRNGRKNQKFFLIHRLVAIAFIEKVNGKEYVNHKDGDKFNNAVSNLEWVTQSENQLHAYETGLQKFTNEQLNILRENAIKRRRPIRVVNELLGINAVFNSITEAGQELACNKKTIRNSLKMKHKSRLGYEATYV